MDISNIIYQAVYSGVPVYEVMCRGINVMRRREDSCLNATQILKVAGIEKGKRTKILEREVLTGDHEKVQGGYGKYQGTWVPLQRGVDLARQYKVEPLLRLLFEFEIPPGEDLETPTKDMVHARIRKRRIIRRSSISSSPTTSPTAMRSQMPHLQHHQHHAHMSGLQHPGQEPFHYPPPSMTPSPLHPSFSASSPSVPPSPQWYMEHPPRKRHKTTTTPPPLHSFDDDFSPRQHFIHNSHGYPYQGQYLHNPRYGQDRGPTHVYNPYPSPQRPYPPPPMPSPLSQSPHALKAQQQQQQLQHPPPPTFHHYHQQQYPPSHQPHQPQPPPYSQQRPQQQYLHSTYDSEGSRPQLYPSWGSQGPIEYYRATLMGIFLNEESDPVPDLLLNPNPPSDFDIDLVIDDQGHTALHWAAALARIRILDILTKRRANVQQVNVNGETALIRAVMVTNNFDRQSFAHLVRVLRESIPVVDKKNRTVLHHIAITASIRTREAGARYYMECLLEWIARNGGDFSMVDIQDKNGDTALTIAARVGDRYLVRMLLDIGANPEIENKVGLKAGDFGFDNGWPGPASLPAHTAAPAPSEDLVCRAVSNNRGRELMSVVQKMVRELDLEFSQELSTRQEQLEEAQEQLRRATRDLDETRQTVQDCRAQTLGLVEAQQRIKNLEQSLEEEIHKVRAQRGYSATTRYKEDKEIDMLFSVSPPTSPPLLPTVGPLPLQQPNHSKDEPNGDHHADFVKDFNGVREKNEKVEGDPSVDTNGTENNLEPTETSQKKDTNVRQSETTTGAAIADKEVQEKEEASIREREHRAEQGVVHWRARVLAYERNERELTEELSKSKKTSTEQEQACRKVISICCGIPLEQVDVMLSSLTKAAIEKDSTNLDMTRIKAIMATLRQQRVALAAKEPVETASTPTSASISVAASDSITGSTSVPTSTPESASSGPELKTVTMEEDTPTTML